MLAIGIGMSKATFHAALDDLLVRKFKNTTSATAPDSSRFNIVRQASPLHGKIVCREITAEEEAEEPARRQPVPGVPTPAAVVRMLRNGVDSKLSLSAQPRK